VVVWVLLILLFFLNWAPIRLDTETLTPAKLIEMTAIRNRRQEPVGLGIQQPLRSQKAKLAVGDMTLIDAVDKELEARPGVAPTQTLLFQQGLHMEPSQQGLGLLMVRSVHRPCHIDSLLVGRTFSQSFLVFYLNYTLDVVLPLCFIPTLRQARHPLSTLDDIQE
jgi:hypothetical protein